MNLYLTADGYYAGTMKDAGKGHMAVDVPTDKQGLIAYLNGLAQCAKVDRITGEMKGAGLTFSTPESPARGPEDDELSDEPIAPLEARTAFTQAQVDGLFSAQSDELRELSFKIAKLPLADLGFIAFELGHRFSKLGVKA